MATADALMSWSTICSRIMSSMAANPGTSRPVTVHCFWAAADTAIASVAQAAVVMVNTVFMANLPEQECVLNRGETLDGIVRSL